MKETFLLEGFPITSPRGYLGWANVLLLEDGERRAVVDTGGLGDRGRLLRRMEEVGLDPRSVEVLILTHLHFDHCLNLDLFARARIVLGQSEYEYVAGGAYRGQGDTGIPPFILTLLDQRDLLLVEEETEIWDGLRVLPTPGHTPGSISAVYVAAGEPTVACGDLVKNAREFLRGPDAAEAQASLALVCVLTRRFVPGHDRPFRIEGTGIRYEDTRAVEIQVVFDPQRDPDTTRWRFE